MNNLPPKNQNKAKIAPEDTLRLLASVQPPEGLAERIEGRLSAARMEQVEPTRSAWWKFSFVMEHPRAVAAACALCVVVGGGFGVYHARHSAPLPPPVRLNPGAMGAAGAIRVAPAGVLPPKDVTARPAPKNFHGRAVVSPGRKPLPKGVAVPHTPPPGDNDGDPQSPQK